MIILQLARKSLFNRSLSVALSILAIALSVLLVLSVEKIREGVRQGFLQTISGTDLVVGARASGVQLLLSSVFRIGNVSNSINEHSIEFIEAQPEVDWVVPISLGDSYHGYRVLGTVTGYFDHYKYGGGKQLAFSAGERFSETLDVVLGAEVAAKLDHKLGDKIILAHGAGSVAFITHDEDPFVVTGILARTGTPIDQSVHVSLAAIDAIHEDWQPGVGKGESDHEDHDEPADHDEDEEHDEGDAHDEDYDEGEEHHDEHKDHYEDDERHEEHDENEEHHDEGEEHHDDHENHEDHDEDEEHDHEHASGVSAAFIGLHSRVDALALQRRINEYEGEPLSAILPGVAFADLWRIISGVDKALFAISLLVVVAAIISMIIVMVSTLDSRRREMAILRAVGARPRHIFALFLFEAGLIAVAGIVVGFVLTNMGVFLAQDMIQTRIGVQPGLGWPSAREGLFVIGLVSFSLLGGLLPALYATRLTLADGLSVKS